MCVLVFFLIILLPVISAKTNFAIIIDLGFDDHPKKSTVRTAVVFSPNTG